MVAGHSYLPCDRAFGLIENKLKRKQSVNCPSECIEIIKSTGANVFEMNTNDFFNFKGLKAFVTERKPKGFNFTEGRTFKISTENHWSYLITSRKGVETISLEPERKATQ